MKISILSYSRWYVLALLLTLSGCKVKRPKEVLSEVRMENLLYDYHIAKAMGENQQYSENYKKALYVNYVFEKHGTTEEVFDSSMVWYARNTEVLSKVYEKVNKRLKTKQEEIDNLIALRDKKPKTSAPGDSIDVWAEQRVYYLTGYPLNNKMTFILPSDKNFEKRDSLSWEVRYRFFGAEPDTANAAVMAMQVIYTNDSVVSTIKKVLKTGWEYIGIKSDTLGDIKAIKGFIYFPKRDTLERNLLLDKIVLTRYHAKDSLPELKADTLGKEKLKKEESQEASSSSATQQQDNKPESPGQRRNERPRPVMKEEPKKED